jgi:predicted transcriptional regulator
MTDALRGLSKTPWGFSGKHGQHVEGKVKKVPSGRIDKAKLRRMLTEGKSQVDIARRFGVTRSAVSKAAKELRIAVVRDVQMENAHRMVSGNLNAVEQLAKINAKANELLDAAVEKEDNAAVLSFMREIRGQLTLQLDLLRCLFDLRTIEEFQGEVLNAIGEVSPETRRKIVERLREKRAVRSLIA